MHASRTITYPSTPLLKVLDPLLGNYDKIHRLSGVFLQTLRIGESVTYISSEYFESCMLTSLTSTAPHVLLVYVYHIIYIKL